MMLLAQTTQQTVEIVREVVRELHQQSGGFTSWTPEQWILVISAGLIPLIIAWRGNSRATEAKTEAVQASTKADAVQKSNDRISDGLHAATQAIVSTNQTVASIAKDMTPMAVQQRLDLLQASKEARDNP